LKHGINSVSIRFPFNRVCEGLCSRYGDFPCVSLEIDAKLHRDADAADGSLATGIVGAGHSPSSDKARVGCYGTGGA